MNQSSQPTEVQTHDYTAVESSRKKAAVIVICLIIVLAISLVIWLVWGKMNGNRAEPLETTAAQESAALGQGVFEHDKDGDGISDGKELKMGMSDLEFDTDGDGLADAVEVAVWKTDPTNVDSDGDGFADGYEVINGFNPAGKGKLK